MMGSVGGVANHPDRIPMRTRIALLLFALLLAIAPSVAKAQDDAPLTHIAYMKAVVEHGKASMPLTQSLIDSFDAVTARPAIVKTATWKRTMSRLVDELSRVNSVVYFMRPPSSLADEHLLYVAGIAHIDAALDQMREYLKSGDMDAYRNFPVLMAVGAQYFLKFAEAIKSD